MKVQCDVCEKAPATLLCCADEAALCAQCDTQVHVANKLAGKHERVALIDQPLSSCDICQEKSGHFFCVEDRALLCRECDVNIHTTNKLVSKHKRFLVSGVRVGLEAMAPPPLRPPSPPPHLECNNIGSTMGQGAMMPPPLPPLVSNSITNIATMESIQNMVLHPPSQTWPSSQVPSITLSPPHPQQAFVTPSIYVPDCVAHLDEFLNLSTATTFFTDTPSKMSFPNLEWGMQNSILALDMLNASTYLYEDSFAEVPSTPIAPPLSSIEDLSSFKRKRYPNEPTFSPYDHNILVHNTHSPPFKQSKSNFYGGGV